MLSYFRYTSFNAEHTTGVTERVSLEVLEHLDQNF